MDIIFTAEDVYCWTEVKDMDDVQEGIKKDAIDELENEERTRTINSF